MKKIKLLFILSAVTLIFTSCELVADIFKAGMGFGIFIVIAVIVLVLVLVMRIGKKK